MLLAQCINILHQQYRVYVLTCLALWSMPTYFAVLVLLKKPTNHVIEISSIPDESSWTNRPDPAWQNQQRPSAATSLTLMISRCNRCAEQINTDLRDCLPYNCGAGGQVNAQADRQLYKLTNMHCTSQGYGLIMCSLLAQHL